MAENSELDRRRRDLYAISLGVLIYNLAGGHLAEQGNTLSLFGGTVLVVRAWVLVAGAWIMWLYFLWQFVLAAKPIWRQFVVDLNSETQAGEIYGAYCDRIFTIFADKAARQANGESVGLTTYDHSTLEAFVSTARTASKKRVRLLVDNNSIAREFHHTQGALQEGTFLGEVLHPVHDSFWDELLSEKPWVGKLRSKALLKALPATVFRRHEFSNRVLPLLVAAAAAIAQTLRWLWHLDRLF